MSQVFSSNKCEHGFEPRIVCDICFPPLTETNIAIISKGGKAGVGVVDQYDPDATINCEMDGEPVAGVRYVTTGIDRDGNVCLMIFTDLTLAAHVAAGDWADSDPYGRL